MKASVDHVNLIFCVSHIFKPFLMFRLLLSAGFLLFPGCDARPYLLFANKRDIRLFEVSPQRAATSSKTTVVVKQLEDAAALDFFLTDNRVCWSEIKLAVIKCSDVDPKKKGRVEKVKKDTKTNL